MSSKKYGKHFVKKLRAFRVPPGVTARFIEEYLASLDSPRSLAVWLMFRENEHEQLVELEVDPVHYNSVEDFRNAYAATEFLSKYKALALNRDRKEVALRKFTEFEELCRHTNSRFRDLSRDPLFRGPRVWLHSAIIRKIERLLGDFDVAEFFSLADWGPGASTSIKRRRASPVEKFQSETGITRDLHSLVTDEIIEDVYPLWFSHLKGNGFPSYEVGNKIITVPKNAKTDRVIAVEPGLNLWFQLSIGRMVSRRLSWVGIDLRYQDRNQELSRLGSATGEVATVDLSSASDSISSAVVEELIPPRWFSIMDSCRSRYGVQNGTLRRWEKFSSMGNGFTFPLESLIFYAVAYCCTEYTHQDTSLVGAYGDDIVVPTGSFALFSEMLEFYGFRINRKKSHSDSPFRESCGAHYFSGVDVKPIYLKDRLADVPAVFRAANAVRRLAHRRNANFGCDSKFLHVFELLVHSIPREFRLRIDNRLGDGGFISNFDEATPAQARTHKRTLGFEGYLCVHLTEISLTYQSEELGYLLTKLWSPPAPLIPSNWFEKKFRTRLKATYSEVFGDPTSLAHNTVPSKRGTRYQIVRSLVPQWCNLGPWI